LFLFKHFSPLQILTEFVPAERERILLLPPDELRAGQVALTEILAMWSVATRELSELPEAAEEIGNLLEALRMLRESIVRRQGGAPAFSRPRLRESSRELGREAETSQRGLTNVLVDELETLWEIRETPFTSRVPILGRWIVAFRNLWNSVATQWYVRPLLAQQVQFNGAVVRALLQLHAQHRDLHAHYWDGDALLALLAERCGMMATHVAELEARLAQAEEQLGDIGEEVK